MASGSSQFMLIFRESTPDRYEAMSRDQRRKALDAWNDWCADLAAEGRLQSGSPLQPAGRIVGGSGGDHVVDGPFAEAKELIGGYFLIAAADLAEATAIAERSPNLPYGQTVEVRPVAPCCHLARSLGWETMHAPETPAVSGLST